MKLKLNSYALVRQVKPKDRWVDPVKPEYQPYWMVALKSPTDANTMVSGRHYVLNAAAICDECKGLPKGESAAKVWPCKGAKHDCQKALRRFLDKLMDERNRVYMQLLQSGEIARVRSALKVVEERSTKIMRVLEHYRKHGPVDSRNKNANAFVHMVEESFGRSIESMKFADLKGKDWVYGWMVMRQEYVRRGWSVNRGRNAPQNAWDVLRDELQRGRLPALDTRTPWSGNTTIMNYLSGARAMLGKKAQAMVLRDFDIPEMEWLEDKLSLPKSQGYKEIDEDTYTEMIENMEKVRESDLPMWIWLRSILAWGVRPKELECARMSWVTVDYSGRRVMVFKNRPDEGFILKAGSKAAGVTHEIPEDLWEVVKDFDQEWALFGQLSPHAISLLRRRASAWIRKYVGTDSVQTNYLFRHNKAAIVYTMEGEAAASKALGHAVNSQVTMRKYAKNLDSVPALTAEVMKSRGRKKA